MCFYREDNKLLAKRVFAKFVRAESPTTVSDHNDVKQEAPDVKQETTFLKDETKRINEETPPSQHHDSETCDDSTHEFIHIPTRLPVSTDISHPSSERNQDSPVDVQRFLPQFYNFNLSHALLANNFHPRKIHQTFPVSYNYFRTPQTVIPNYAPVSLNVITTRLNTMTQEITNAIGVNMKYINQMIESQERGKKKLLRCLEELKGCSSKIDSPTPITKNIMKIHEARLEAQLHNNNPTSTELFSYLFGKKTHRYNLVLNNTVSNPLLRDKNVVLDINLIDVITGKVVKNTNRIHLQVQLQTWEVPSNNITRNRNGNKAISGQIETDLKQGYARFDRVQVSEVTSKFMNGYVAIVVVPGQPSNHGTYLIDEEEQENFINFEDIKPLMIEKIVVKSKKKPFM